MQVSDDLGEMRVSSVLYTSLKRQEPTRLSQSQSPSPLSADIYIKRPHHLPETQERTVALLGLWRYSDSNWPPPCFFSYFTCLFASKETLLLPETPRVPTRILSSRQNTSSEALLAHLVDIVFSC